MKPSYVPLVIGLAIAAIVFPVMFVGLRNPPTPTPTAPAQAFADTSPVATAGREITVTEYAQFRRASTDHLYRKVVWYDARASSVVVMYQEVNNRLACYVTTNGGEATYACPTPMPPDRVGHGSTLAAALADYARRNP